MRRKTLIVILEILLIAAAGLILASVIPVESYPEEARDYFYRRGVEETGASNLVSAIYLRYRNYDTLGETIILFLAISGVTLLVGSGEKR